MPRSVEHVACPTRLPLQGRDAQALVQMKELVMAHELAIVPHVPVAFEGAHAVAWRASRNLVIDFATGCIPNDRMLLRCRTSKRHKCERRKPRMKLHRRLARDPEERS